VVGSLGVAGSSFEAELPLLLDRPTMTSTTIKPTTAATASTIPIQPATPQPPRIFAAPPPDGCAGAATGGAGGGGAGG
jgi:hypothetical protein